MPTTKLRHMKTTAPLLRGFFGAVATSLIVSASMSQELDDGDGVEKDHQTGEHDAECDVAIATRFALRFGKLDQFHQNEPPAYETSTATSRSSISAENTAKR